MEAGEKEYVRLVGIMNELREKCPWDRKQTLQSLRHLTIEETYELADAIMENDLKKLRNELGDLLLHIVFYTRIAWEQQAFTPEEMMHALCEKLIKRHPHIYGDVKVENEGQVKENWEKIKLKEKESMTSEGFRSVLAGVPLSLPAMVKAWRIQEKARAVGFDWEKEEQVWDKVKEEMDELNVAHKDGEGKERTEEEFGDLLFALVNYARFLGVNPEDALEKSNRKFIRRFRKMEAMVAEKGRLLSEMTLAEMDHFWDEAKKKGE